MDDIFPEPTKSSPKIEYLVSARLRLFSNLEGTHADLCKAILIGANDAVLPFSPTKQHCPVEEYKENLTKIVNHPRVKQSNPKILLVTPPPIDELKHGKLDAEAGISSPIRTSAISASYSEKAREVAKENEGVVLIDLWQALMDKAISMAPDDYQPGGPWLGSPQNGKAGGLDTLLPDGLHMCGEAYRVFFDALRLHIGQEWSGKEDDDVFVYPTWRKLQGVAAAAKVSVSDN